MVIHMQYIVYVFPFWTQYASPAGGGPRGTAGGGSAFGLRPFLHRPDPSHHALSRAQPVGKKKRSAQCDLNIRDLTIKHVGL